MQISKSILDFCDFLGQFCEGLNGFTQNNYQLLLEQTIRNCIQINMSLVAWVHRLIPTVIAFVKSNFDWDAVAFNWQQIQIEAIIIEKLPSKSYWMFEQINSLR